MSLFLGLIVSAYVDIIQFIVRYTWEKLQQNKKEFRRNSLEIKRGRVSRSDMVFASGVRSGATGTSSAFPTATFYFLTKFSASRVIYRMLREMC